MKDPKKYTLLWLAFMLLNILIIVFIAYREFHRSDYTAFSLGQHGIAFLLGGLACLLVILITETAKCVLIMRSLGEKISAGEAFEIIALGRYYDALMPTGGGGQPFQIVWLTAKGYKAKTASAMPATYFITRQLASILITLSVFLFFPHAVSNAIRFAAYAGLAFCCFIPFLELALSLNPVLIKKLITWVLRLGVKLHVIKNYEAALGKVMHTLDQYHEGFTHIAGSKTLLAELLILSLLCRAALLSMPYFVLRAVGSSVTFGSIFVIIVYIYSAVTLIPTPGNAGVSEGTFYYVFSSLGSGGVFWAMLLWRLLCYYSFLLLGLLIFGKRLFKIRGNNV